MALRCELLTQLSRRIHYHVVRQLTFIVPASCINLVATPPVWLHQPLPVEDGMSQMHGKRFLMGGLAIGFVLLLTSAAQAISMSFTASGVGGDGPESAAATVTTGAGTVTVMLSSLITNPTAAGQLVSDLEI